MQENQEKFIELVKKKNDGKNLKYSILTMGCQLNENDSEKIAGMLEKMGYSEIYGYKDADLILVVLEKMQKKDYLEKLEK